MLDQFGLAEATYPVAGYSGGMRRRLDLAMSLMLDPDIVFLDEPTTGVDPRGRAVMWDIVRGLVERGTTIFLTTQYLEEADQLATRVAVLADGRIVAQETVVDGLEHAVDAFLGLLSGSNTGKMVVRVGG